MKTVRVLYLVSHSRNEKHEIRARFRSYFTQTFHVYAICLKRIISFKTTRNILTGNTRVRKTSEQQIILQTFKFVLKLILFDNIAH